MHGKLEKEYKIRYRRSYIYLLPEMAHILFIIILFTPLLILVIITFFIDPVIDAANYLTLLICISSLLIAALFFPPVNKEMIIKDNLLFFIEKKPSLIPIRNMTFLHERKINKIIIEKESMEIQTRNDDTKIIDIRGLRKTELLKVIKRFEYWQKPVIIKDKNLSTLMKEINPPT